MEEIVGRVKIFFREYGKIFSLGILIVLDIVLVIFIFNLATPKKLVVSFFDVGQGDAIFIQTPSGHDMLIDGGPNEKVSEGLSKRMNYFDRDIDVLVATHPDADHVTGLIPVLEKYKIDKIIISGNKSETGIFKNLDNQIENEKAEIVVARKKDEIDFGDGVVAHILYPNGNVTKETNDSSVSLVLKYGGQSFLLTGDLTTKYESQLLQNILPKNITVYKAGHHGSKYSSGEQLLKYIRPEYAIISAGKDNRYGHPDVETITRLQKYSKEILSTVDKGMVSFFSDGKLLYVETEK